MAKKMTLLSQLYEAELQKYLGQRARASLNPARCWGHQAAAFGLETLAVARIHEEAVARLKAFFNGKEFDQRAEIFFNEALVPIEETHGAARQSQTRLSQLQVTLGQRTRELAASDRQVKRGLVRRKVLEIAAGQNGKHHDQCLEESLQLQEYLRALTHRVLAAQEDERAKISHELQDEIAQTLLGINVRLLSLKHKTGRNIRGLKNEIASARRLVVKSAASVRRFARTLGARPGDLSVAARTTV